jgi:hypothetical protein
MGMILVGQTGPEPRHYGSNFIITPNSAEFSKACERAWNGSSWTCAAPQRAI